MEMLPKGEFHNGHNVIAFIGSYDEATHTFTKENVQLMDGGIDFYATQTTLAPDGRRLMTAWLQTWSDTEDKPQAASGSGRPSARASCTSRTGASFRPRCGSWMPPTVSALCTKM